MKNSPTLTRGVVVQLIGGEVLVFVPGGANVMRLSHDAASIVLDLQAGKSVDSSSSTVAELLDLGVLATTGFSRRGLIKAGAIGAGAGIAVLAMPQAAMAASETLPAPILTNNNNGVSGFGGSIVEVDGVDRMRQAGIFGASINYSADLGYEISFDNVVFFDMNLLPLNPGEDIQAALLPGIVNPAPGQPTFPYFVRAKRGGLVSASTQGIFASPFQPG